MNKLSSVVDSGARCPLCPLAGPRGVGEGLAPGPQVERSSYTKGSALGPYLKESQGKGMAEHNSLGTCRLSPHYFSTDHLHAKSLIPSFPPQ